MGEDIPDTNSISFTIADRLAYLMAKTQKDRKEIRKDFRELYALRSKFIHGKKTSLIENERALYWWGRDLLDVVLRKEIEKII